MSTELGLDDWERRLERASAAVPYLVLVISMGLTISAAPVDRGQLTGTLLLATFTGVWMLWWVTLHPQWRERRALMACYFIGLMVLYTILQHRAPTFGFFAFAGYVHASMVLRGRWVLVGIAVTALISATALFGGTPPTRWSDVGSYALLVVVIVTLAITFSFLGHITTEQSRQRKLTVARLAEANQQLEETLQENAGLHEQLLTQAREAGRLDERQRMAREIHDTLAQGLAGVITQVQAAQHAKDRPDDQTRHLDLAADLARQSLTEARRSVHALRPEQLETARLPEALSDVARQWSSQHGLDAEVRLTGTARPLHPEVEITLLRAGQEALANVAKHARASRVALTLSYMEDLTTLDVVDDGVGFDPDEVRNGQGFEGFGLLSMRQRVELLDGALAVESELGSGTALSASVPAVGRWESP
ncbi:MAG: sensor histidine kinase [Propionibacteriaceae bacterium]